MVFLAASVGQSVQKAFGSRLGEIALQHFEISGHGQHMAYSIPETSRNVVVVVSGFSVRRADNGTCPRRKVDLRRGEGASPDAALASCKNPNARCLDPSTAAPVLIYMGLVRR